MEIMSCHHNGSLTWRWCMLKHVVSLIIGVRRWRRPWRLVTSIVTRWWRWSWWCSSIFINPETGNIWIRWYWWLLKLWVFSVVGLDSFVHRLDCFQQYTIHKGCLGGAFWATRFHCILGLLLTTLHSSLHSQTKSLNSLVQSLLNLIWLSFKILHNICHTHKLISDHRAEF